MPTSQDSESHARFFSVKRNESKKSVRSLSLPRSVESQEGDSSKRCWTLRILQNFMPCLKTKGRWDPSQGDIFKSHDPEEAEYPRLLRLLENPALDCIFLLSSILSIYLFLFSEGFLLKSRNLWGVLHLVNAVYALGLLCKWLQLLLKSKYAKTNHGYTTRDIVYTLLSVCPGDLIVLAIYSLNDENDKNLLKNSNPIANWMITVSRLNYFLRIRDIQYYFSKWEDRLVIGDFKMFLMRTFFFATLLIHMVACMWHRIACNSFEHSHFLMTPDEAIVDVCESSSWIGVLQRTQKTPLLDHPGWNVVLTHYAVAVYWTVVATFRLGAGDIKTSLNSDLEIAFVSVTEIIAWIFVLTHVNGTLTSLLIEKDTEKENFFRRCFAIRHYLQFGEVVRTIQDDVNRFYDYLWKRSSGLLNIDLVDYMPQCMKSEMFYDVNKFVLDQLPLLKGLETPFLMSLSVRTNHRFYMSGEILFKRNEISLALYYLVKGHLEVLSDDDRHVITTIRSGSAIGEMHLLQPYPHIATVRCGSDCEIRTLSRKHFKQVLNIYPQYVQILEQRLETRLEQSALLLALCEKHNTYQKAFKALREYKEHGSIVLQHSDLSHSFENVTNILSAKQTNENPNLNKTHRATFDMDGLSLNSEIQGRLYSSAGSDNSYMDKKGYEESLAAAYEALESDVARAGALANDLNIPRPPLAVTAPGTSTHVTLGFRQQRDAENICISFFKLLKNPQKGGWILAWKFLVALAALLVFWYYPYQFGFKDPSFMFIDYVAHISDVIFALDCFYDMIQIVVTPRRTFESAKEIAVYRFKSFYFYLRIFAFLPLEYILGVYIVNKDSPYFYLFKLNRLVQIHLVFRFLSELETRFRIKLIVMIMGKFALGVFFVAHIFAVWHAFVLKTHEFGYRHCFYWSLVITVSLGYGDIRAKSDAELVVEVLGLVVGVCAMVYMTAKVASMLVNSERRRKSFKHLLYSLDAFMKQRKFPKALSNRVSNYYNMQWRAHQGTLIPSAKPIMWDCPKAVVTRVSHAISYKHLARIPLFTYAPIYLQNEICLALKSFLVPPEEILLHPNELASDLYIISKGYVEVSLGGKPIAVFTEGRYFGLNGLLYGVNTQFMFKTLTHCHIYCLSRDSFEKVITSNPNFIHEVEFLTDDHRSAPMNLPNSPNYETNNLPTYPSKEFLENLAVEGNLCSIGSDYDKINGNAVTSCFRRMTRFCRNPSKMCYFLPSGTVIKWWMGIRLSVAVFATIFSVAQVAFRIDPHLGFSVSLFFDIVAWTDILISMRCAYYGDKKQLVTDSKKMAIHYMKGAFLIDVIAVFPADMFVFFAECNGSIGSHEHSHEMHHIVSLLRLNRVLQCYKIFLTNAILEKTMFKSLSFVMLVEIAPAMFLFINTTMCLSVIAVCGFSRHSLLETCLNDSWIKKGLVRLDYEDKTHEADELDFTSISRAYYIGLYWVTQTVLCVGYGDIEIGTSAANQIVAIVVAFIGVLSAAYAGGKLTSCMVGEDPSKTELQEKMNLMNNYLEQQRVSGNVRRRVRETYLNAWDKTKGVSPTVLFQALPPTLKVDVMKQLYGPTLKSSPLFENLDGPGLRMLASSLQEIFYPEGEFLMKFGDLCNDIFFIAHGAVVCYNVRGVIMSQMGGGSIIGEIATPFHTHRLYTAIAVKDVNAYVFKKEAFMMFLAQYPIIKHLLESYSHRHYREAVMGSKRTDGGVKLAMENERQPSILSGMNLKSTHSRSSVQNRSPYFDDLTPSLRGSNQEKFSFTTSVNNDVDLTRNVLKENVLKNAEDLSKVVTEKWWSVLITFGRMARDEMGLVHICQESSQCNLFNFTVHPASSICTWVSFYLFITAISCSITAYEIAFVRSALPNNNNTIPLIAVRDILEVFYILRILGSFHLGYYDETATLIVNVKKISHRYIYKLDGLWLDIATTFPFYLFTDLFAPNDLTDYIRGLQLLRVFLFVRYLQESDSTLKMKASRAKILKTTVLLCFIFHFWACAWYLVACNNTSCLRGSWMHKTLSEAGLRDVEGGKASNLTVTVPSRYLLSLYYVSNALTSTGFSDISARTNIELCLSIMMMFGTVFVIGYLVGEMAQCLASQVATKIHYQHRLSVLENHFTSLGISYEKISAVRDYFKLLWCRCKGATIYNLMEELPYSLRADVAMEVYGSNLKYSRILGKLDENLIRQICARIRHEIYFPGSHIARAGDVCNSMYFIKTGEVVILDGNSNLEMCVEILYENECFGEVKLLLPREQYRFSYVARIETEVGVLNKEDLDAVLTNHPRIYEEIKEKANTVKARKQSLDDKEEKPKSQKSSTSVKSKH